MGVPELVILIDYRILKLLNFQVILENQIAAEREKYQPSAAEKIFAIVKSMLLRGLVIYFFMTMFRRPATNPTEDPAGTPNLPKGAAVNLFNNGTIFDLYVFLSEDSEFVNFNDSSALIWKKEGLIYGDWESGPNGDGTYSFSTTLETSAALQNNGSIYLHSFVVKGGKSPDPATGSLFLQFLFWFISYNLHSIAQ